MNTAAILLALCLTALPTEIDQAVKSLATPRGDVYALNKAFTPDALVPALLDALENDPDFAHGRPARENIILALAGTRLPNGDPGHIADRRQLEILVESLSWVSVSTRLEVIRMLPAAAVRFPLEVKNSIGDLLLTDDSSVLRTALNSARDIGGLSERSLPTLRSLAKEPGEANPAAWASAADFEAQLGGPRGRVKREIHRTTVTVLLQTTDDIDTELDWMIQVRGAAVPAVAFGVMTPMGHMRNEVFPDADVFARQPLETQRRWVRTLAALMALPEAATIATGEGMPMTLDFFFSKFPDLKPELAELSIAVLAHSLTAPARESIHQLLEQHGLAHLIPPPPGGSND